MDFLVLTVSALATASLVLGGLKSLSIKDDYVSMAVGWTCFGLLFLFGTIGTYQVFG